MSQHSAPKKKIAILLPNLEGGGAERVSLDLAHGFKRAGHKVEIVVMSASGALLEEAKNSFSVIDLAVRRARYLPWALYKYLRNRKPDHLMGVMWPITVISPIVAKMSGVSVNVLIVEHGILSAQYSGWGFIHRIMMRLSVLVGYRIADHRVGVSTGVVKSMACLSQMPSDKFRVIYNPIPLRRLPDARLIADVEALWNGPCGCRILTVGSMKKVKNHSLLMRAFEKLRHPEKRLMFVGSGEGLSDLRELAQSLKIADRVIFAGFQPDPTAFYKTADLFVLSSDREGFGNVIVEALATGTPVVSTDCPTGPGEILDNGRFGWLVSVGDEVALAEAIELALEQEACADELKRRASDFRPELAIDDYLNLIGLR